MKAATLTAVSLAALLSACGGNGSSTGNPFEVTTGDNTPTDTSTGTTGSTGTGSTGDTTPQPTPTDTTPPTAVAGECTDPDGDGYGWNGVESCTPPAPTVTTPQPTPPAADPAGTSAQATMTLRCGDIITTPIPGGGSSYSPDFAGGRWVEFYADNRASDPDRRFNRWDLYSGPSRQVINVYQDNGNGWTLVEAMTEIASGYFSGASSIMSCVNNAVYQAILSGNQQTAPVATPVQQDSTNFDCAYTANGSNHFGYSLQLWRDNTTTASFPAGVFWHGLNSATWRTPSSGNGWLLVIPKTNGSTSLSFRDTGTGRVTATWNGSTLSCQQQ